MTEAEFQSTWGRIRPAFQARLLAERLPLAQEEALARIYLTVAAWVLGRKKPGQALVVGVNGAQGAGKSTLCRFLRLILEQGFGLKAAHLSLDDFYLTRAERLRLAQQIHPLLATRGVPGTHAVELALDSLQALVSKDCGQLAWPAFDKACDDRRPQADWPLFQGPADVVLFEGWCVGTPPQADAELEEPVNTLERDEDPERIWRRFVNGQLQGAYAKLFARLDTLVFLQVPGMDSVLGWRGLQEQKLAESAAAKPGQHRLMDTAGLRRFIMHYERLTRHGLKTLPPRAGLVLTLNDEHQLSLPLTPSKP